VENKNSYRYFMGWVTSKVADRIIPDYLWKLDKNI